MRKEWRHRKMHRKRNPRASADLIRKDLHLKNQVLSSDNANRTIPDELQKAEVHKSVRRKLTAKSSRKHSSKYTRVGALLFDIDSEISDSDEVEDDVVFDEQIPSLLMYNQHLNALAVRNQSRMRRRKKVRRRFVDEILPSRFVSPHVSYATESDEDEHAPTPQMALPVEMLLRLPISSVSNLRAFPRLPCYPPTWEIHKRDSFRLLGHNFPFCVIARLCGDFLRFSIVYDCPSFHPSRLQFPTSMEIPPTIQNHDGKICEICYREIDLTSENRLSHPFSLSCSHVFCTGCWLVYITESIQQKNLPTVCPSPNCSSTISFAAATGLLSTESIEIYERSTIECLKLTGKLFACPECTRLHYTDGPLRTFCPCGTSLCAHCFSIVHSPLGCNAFRQYDEYLRSHCFASVYSTALDAPIVGDLCQCPGCNTLMQIEDKRCNRIICQCGMQFCLRCSEEYLREHYGCKRKNITISLIDVIKSRHVYPLIPSQLPRAIQSRIELLERRKILRRRMLGLPVHDKKVYERTFVQLSVILECIGLCFGEKQRTWKRVMKRLRLLLDDFLYTSPAKDISEKGRALKEFHDTFADTKPSALTTLFRLKSSNIPNYVSDLISWVEN